MSTDIYKFQDAFLTKIAKMPILVKKSTYSHFGKNRLVFYITGK
jgi:hypothetical protein